MKQTRAKRLIESLRNKRKFQESDQGLTKDQIKNLEVLFLERTYKHKKFDLKINKYDPKFNSYQVQFSVLDIDKDSWLGVDLEVEILDAETLNVISASWGSFSKGIPTATVTQDLDKQI